jgi:hypothetical protein
MKKIIVFVFTICIYSCSHAFGQIINEASLFAFCKFTGESITLKELKKCPELTSKNKKLEVKSYTFVIFAKSSVDNLENVENAGKEGLYVEYKIVGNKISDEAFKYLERPNSGHLKILIEDIKAVENGEEKKFNGFVFYLR